MPFYNNKRDLEKAIKGVLDNTTDSTEAELILVDDGSEDGSIRIAQYYTEKYDFIKLLVNEENLGPAKALKKALQFATGEIIIFTAADDISFKNRTSEVVNIFREYEDVGIVVSEAEIINEADLPTGEYYSLPSSLNIGNAFLYQLKRNYCLGATMSIRNRQDLFAKENFLELIDDYQISLDYLLAGWKIYPLKEVLLQYRVHNQSVSSRKKDLHLKTLSTLTQYAAEKIDKVLISSGVLKDEASLALGIFELFKGNRAKAENYFNRIDVLSNTLDRQSRVEYYFYQGIFKYERNEIGEALKDWKEVLRLQPNNFVVLNNLGVLLLSTDKGEAERLIKEACDLNPSYLDGHTNLKMITNDLAGELLITQRLLSNSLIKRNNYLKES